MDNFLDRLRNWQFNSMDDFHALIGELQKRFEPYGRVWEEDGRVKVATGGWSDNEEMITALQGNFMFWAMFWESSHRGGLFVFRPVSLRQTSLNAEG